MGVRTHPGHVVSCVCQCHNQHRRCSGDALNVRVLRALRHPQRWARALPLQDIFFLTCYTCFLRVWLSPGDVQTNTSLDKDNTTCVTPVLLDFQISSVLIRCGQNTKLQMQFYTNSSTFRSVTPLPYNSVFFLMIEVGWHHSFMMYFISDFF